MSDRKIPAYLEYVTHDKKRRLLVGEAEYFHAGDDVILQLEFEEWLLTNDDIPVSLVYGERAERISIGTTNFPDREDGVISILKLKLDPKSEVVRMLPIARSFVLGF